MDCVSVSFEWDLNPRVVLETQGLEACLGLRDSPEVRAGKAGAARA